MNIEKFNAVVLEQLKKCERLLIVKGHEYAFGVDRLIAFKMAAALQGETTAQALCGMWAKHIISIFDMTKAGGEFTVEKWEEKITDAINYLLLLKAVILEENYTNANGGKNEKG